MQKININKDWEFEKEGVKSVVSLPHTWNGEDGQSALADTKLVGTDGGAIRKDRFSVNDKVSEILDDKEAHTALKLLAGDIIDKWFVNLVRPFKVSTLLKIAHIDPQLRDLVNGFLQTIKNSK